MGKSLIRSQLGEDEVNASHGRVTRTVKSELIHERAEIRLVCKLLDVES